jgi:hypothetical protein
MTVASSELYGFVWAESERYPWHPTMKNTGKFSSDDSTLREALSALVLSEL